MKNIILLSLFALSNTSYAINVSPYKTGQKLTHEQAEELQQRYKTREQQPWEKPDSAEAITKHPNAELIKYGIQVLDKTVETIGPNVDDKSKRYSGNSLNCSSCHLKGDTQLPGTKYDAIPFTNVTNDYPQFRGRDMSIATAAARSNGCMTRSMGHGKELPLDSKEMKGILAYYDWLAEGTKKNQAMDGSGLPPIKLPDRKADVTAGKDVYQTYCVACHGQGALGLKAPDYEQTGNYTFPPLAGEDSFDDGAGMSRLIKASRFVHTNMPLGAGSENPMLTVDQAFDVSAYFLSLPRENRKGRENDFPDPGFRPADYPVPEYFKGDTKALEKAKLGPYTK